MVRNQVVTDITTLEMSAPNMSETHPNVLLIVLDSVKSGHLSSYGYNRETSPGIDRFAENAFQFDGWANSSWTVPAHGTLFTGRYPSQHGADATNKQLAVRQGTTVAERLSEVGYRTVGISANPWISSDFGYDQGFDEFENLRSRVPFELESHPQQFNHVYKEHRDWRKYLDAAKWAFDGHPIKRAASLLSFHRGHDSYARADYLTDTAVNWLASAQGSDGPFFMFMNYMDAHDPYDHELPEVEEFSDSPWPSGANWNLPSLEQSFSEEEERNARALYDGSIRYLDRHVERLLDHLSEAGLFEDTLVVLTSDHGKCLGDHGYMGVGTFLHDELLEVPLVVSPPRNGPVGSYDPDTDRVVEQVEIAHTILAAADLDVEPSMDLLSSDDPEPRGTFAETAAPHQDIEIENVSAEGYRRVDTAETSFRLDVEADEVTTMPEDASEAPRGEMERLEEAFRARFDHVRRDSAAAQMDEDVRGQLEELGYL